MTTLMVFGAGLIGRGLLAEAAAGAGWRSILIEAQPDLCARLRTAGEFQVHLRGRTSSVTRVRDWQAHPVGDGDAVARGLDSADLAATAVGGAQLPGLAAVLADGLRRRTRPLPILVCENWPQADAVLARALAERGVAPEQAVCVPVSVERMVRGVAGSLDVVGESDAGAYVETARLPADTGLPPAFTGVTALEPYYARKLFTNNAGHALLAYEGYLAGHTALPDCVADPAIAANLAALLDGAARMLARDYGLAPEALHAHTENLIQWRYANRHLADTVRRVGRDPARKLAPAERLVGLLRQLERAHLPTAPVCQAIAAAFRYNDPDDPPAAAFHAEVVRRGVGPLLNPICGIGPDEAAHHAILEYDRQFTKQTKEQP